MKLNELNREQVLELKRNYVSKKMEEAGECADMMELMDADDNVSMEDLTAEYGDTEFVPEDFACSATQPTEAATDRPRERKATHTLNFTLHYADGVICDRTRPMRSVELSCGDPYALLETMEQMFHDDGIEIGELEFELDGVMYEYNECVMHGYYHSRITFAEALEMMRMGKAA